MADSRAPMFVALASLATFLALAVVTLRVGYRASKKSLIAADYMIMVAMFFSLVHYAFDMSLVAYFGYGKHIVDIPPNEQWDNQEGIIVWVLDIIVKACLAFPKLSLCLIYRKLVAGADGRLVRISRILNYMTFVLVAGYYTAVALVAIFQCTPIALVYDDTLTGTCIDDTGTVGTVTAAINVTTSILLIYIPLPVLFQSRRLKATGVRIEVSQLIALILLGLTDTAMSAVRFFTAFLLRDVTSDFSYAVPPLYVIIIFEYNVLIIAASLVVMRNCFQAIHRFLFPNSRPWLSSFSGFTGSGSGSGSGTRRTTTKFVSDDSQTHGPVQSYDKVGSAAGSAAEVSCRAQLPPKDSPRKPGRGNGIFKTVDVDLNSRSISMEEIISKEDRSPC